MDPEIHRQKFGTFVCAYGYLQNEGMQVYPFELSNYQPTAIFDRAVETSVVGL